MLPNGLMHVVGGNTLAGVPIREGVQLRYSYINGYAYPCIPAPPPSHK